MGNTIQLGRSQAEMGDTIPKVPSLARTEGTTLKGVFWERTAYIISKGHSLVPMGDIIWRAHSWELMAVITHRGYFWASEVTKSLST